jgi:excisionase family DNA binding protein
MVFAYDRINRGKTPMNETNDPNDWLTIDETMAFLSVSKNKVEKMIREGSLPAYKIGGDIRFRRSELLEWLEGYRVCREA